MPTDSQASGTPVRPWMVVLLGAAVVALVIAWNWQSAGAGPAPSNQAGGRTQQHAGGQSPSMAVRLDALKQPTPHPIEADRNPFRFQPKPPPAPPAPPPVPVAPPPPVNTGPPPVSPPPPIPLRFMGFIEGKGPGKIVALSDGVGVYKGREGDTILGQYRIVKVGVESVVMEYLDGRGRQTIPLRGQ